MGSLGSILILGTFALSGHGAPPPSPAAKPATISFVAKGDALAGISYGIDAVDSQPSLLGNRRATQVLAGVHTVSYSCPGEASSRGGASLTFNFAEGGAYQLVCRGGKGEMIRNDDC